MTKSSGPSTEPWGHRRRMCTRPFSWHDAKKGNRGSVLEGRKERKRKKGASAQRSCNNDIRVVRMGLSTFEIPTGALSVILY